MKNFKIQPFEKNNYFYGKLLTVRDFQAEQRYNDEKRWMLNKFMFGSGIAAGLRVVMIDEHTISIEPGVAIDKSGREIVVASPVTQRLSLIDGFENTGYSKAVYLCIDYEDKGNERIQAVTNVEDTSEEVSSYNRIREGFRIYLRENIPDSDENRSSSMTENRTCVINKGKVKVYVTVPRYVCPNEEFEITTEVVKQDLSSRIGFVLNMKSDSSVKVSESVDNSFTVDFNEPEDNLASYHEIKTKVNAGQLPNKNAYFEITASNIRSDGRMLPTENVVLRYGVVNDRTEALIEDYRSMSLDTVAEDDYNTVYLAKIELLKVESTYMIRGIKDCPFGQYIRTARLVGSLIGNGNHSDKVPANIRCESHTSPYIDVPEVDTEIDDNGVTKLSFIFPESSSNISGKTSGQIIFDIDELVNEPKIFYSDEIDHRLGRGDVFVQLAVAGDNNAPDAIICADQSVLCEGGVRAAAVVYPDKGMFKVAINVDFAYVGRRIRVKWLASKA